jgi:serine/threonine-protein kinase
MLGPGATVAGRYRIENLLGEGGYGAVYEATQLNLGRRVALKLMHPSVVAQPEALARFEREVQLAQQLSHPNVVRLFDFGSAEALWPGGPPVPFIVFELLVGRSLDREIAVSGPLPVARVARIAQQVLKALMEAHGLGIVHRDIKPANIFLADFAGEPDFVKVLDFGIAIAPHGGGPGLTREGLSVGTPAYMAPEQVLDRPVDGRTDLYALGLVMAEMLCGEPVFRGTTAMQVALMQADDKPAPLPQSALASSLGPVIARATQKDPSRRFSSASEMLALCRRAPSLPGASGAFPTGPTEAREIAFAPTAGVSTPGPLAYSVGAPRTAPSPPHPGLAASGSVGAQVVRVQTSAPARTRRNTLAIVLGSLAALCAGGAAVYFFGGGTGAAASKKKKKTKKKRAPAESVDSESSDTESAGVEETIEELEVDVEPTSYDDSGLVPCEQAPQRAAQFKIGGVDGATMLQRLQAAGYSCFMLMVVSTAQLGASVNVTMLRDGGRSSINLQFMSGGMTSLFDPNGVIERDPSTGAAVSFSGNDAEQARNIAFGRWVAPGLPATPAPPTQPRPKKH